MQQSVYCLDILSREKETNEEQIDKSTKNKSDRKYTENAMQLTQSQRRGQQGFGTHLRPGWPPPSGSTPPRRCGCRAAAHPRSPTPGPGPRSPCRRTPAVAGPSPLAHQSDRKAPTCLASIRGHPESRTRSRPVMHTHMTNNQQLTLLAHGVCLNVAQESSEFPSDAHLWESSKPVTPNHFMLAAAEMTAHRRHASPPNDFDQGLFRMDTNAIKESSAKKYRGGD